MVELRRDLRGILCRRGAFNPGCSSLGSLSRASPALVALTRPLRFAKGAWARLIA